MKFSKGEILSAEKLNRLAGRVSALESQLARLRITGGNGVAVSKNPSGEFVVALSPGRVAVRRGNDVEAYTSPFAVSVGADGTVYVAPGTSYTLSVEVGGVQRNAAQFHFDAWRSIPGAAKVGGGVVLTDPYPDGTIEVLDDLNVALPQALVIAYFRRAADGRFEVVQLLRSDAFFVRVFEPD